MLSKRSHIIAIDNHHKMANSLWQFTEISINLDQ